PRPGRDTSCVSAATARDRLRWLGPPLRRPTTPTGAAIRQSRPLRSPSAMDSLMLGPCPMTRTRETRMHAAIVLMLAFAMAPAFADDEVDHEAAVAIWET